MECSFCGKIFKGKGKMVVHKKGSITYLCSSKCEKAWKKGKNPRNVSWTKASRKAKEETGKTKKKS